MALMFRPSQRYRPDRPGQSGELDLLLISIDISRDFVMAAQAATHAASILLALCGDADAASMSVTISTYQYVVACASGRLRGRDDFSNTVTGRRQALRPIALPYRHPSHGAVARLRGAVSSRPWTGRRGDWSDM